MTIDQGKHTPFGHTRDWQEVVAETGRRNGKAKYINGLSHDTLRRLELLCAREGLAMGAPGLSWIRMDRIVGASNGQETEFVFVRLMQNGTYHGRPITEDELYRKGVPRESLRLEGIPWDRLP